MDFHKILVFVVAGWFLVGDRVSAYFNQTNGTYTFMLSNVSADNRQGKSALTYAQNWCRSNGYTLAEIPNKEVQNYIQQFIGNVISNGLMNTVEQIILNGKLYSDSPDPWMWVNGQQRNGLNIEDQKDLRQGYFYGFLKTSDRKIYASKNDNRRPYMCEFPGKRNDCPGVLSSNDRCYQIFQTSLTWYGARNECLEGGGDLASFETLNFGSTLVSTLLANTSSTEYWVGIQRVEWRWEDTDSAIKYTNWEFGWPANAYDCLSLRVTSSSPEWLWYNYCAESYRFICIATTTSTATWDTSPPKSASISAQYTTPLFTAHSLPSSVSTTSLPGNNAVLALALGIGLGVGAILIVAIILGVIFIRKRQKSRSNHYSEPTSTSNNNVSNDLNESDIDVNHDEMKNNGTNKYNTSTGNANQGAIYAAVQPRGTLLPPVKDADTNGNQIVYADFDLMQ